MSDIYKNEGGQVLNMGPNGKVWGNTVVQSNVSSLPILKEEDLKKLREFADSLSSISDKEIGKSEALEAASKVYSIVEGFESNDIIKQKKSIERWSEWLNNIGKNSLGVIAITADIVTLGIPLIKLLGL
ncbi:MAG: hypothetical protein ACREV6_05960 [Clostridium sp.]|uniref:hypothetical protein n=1 Tax=Clostridium sp. TaxID=1506 RepID=UPI003D6CFAAF